MRNKPGSVLVMGQIVRGGLHSSSSDKIRQVILTVMNDHKVTRSIRYNMLVITNNNQMCSKHRKPHEYDTMRVKLRLLGKYFISIHSRYNQICVDSRSEILRHR